MNFDARDMRLDGRNVDFVVSLAQNMIGSTESAIAMRTFFSRHAHYLVRIFGQGAACALASDTAFASHCSCGFSTLVGGFIFVALESFGRRYA
ncbi:MAG: hypothetical protein KAS59_00415 [Alphaproteobacteria bacterium]|nr:hypothetical protein [Alphaproteobacteria bacterium]